MFGTIISYAFTINISGNHSYCHSRCSKVLQGDCESPAGLCSPTKQVSTKQLPGNALSLRQKKDAIQGLGQAQVCCWMLSTLKFIPSTLPNSTEPARTGSWLAALSQLLSLNSSSTPKGQQVHRSKLKVFVVSKLPRSRALSEMPWV